MDRGWVRVDRAGGGVMLSLFTSFTSRGMPQVVVRSAVFSLSCWVAPFAIRAAEPHLDDAPGEAMEVLARGPVHEAFAAVTGRDAKPGAVVPRQPPEPVEELPPEVQPEGDNVQWIPGYWAWDEEQEEFIWVSGVWRNGPPGRRWIPGQWRDVEGGHAWISGFWSDADNNVPPPLPAPPDRPDEEPRGEPPDDNHFWIPGCWISRNSVYVWRAGYWTRFWPQWIWVPSYYVWTPGGCLFVNGYWDYSLAHRGFLYAPIRFRHPVYLQRNFRFTPGHCINVSRIHFHLFVQPGCGHYFFGDFHGQRYARRGYLSHTKYHLMRRGHDCLFSYYQTLYRRRGFDYARRVQGWHDYYAKHREHRPPHTQHAQEEVVRKVARQPHPRQSLLVQPIDDFRRRIPTASSAADRLRRARSDTPDTSDRERDALRSGDLEAHRPRDVARRRADILRRRAQEPSPLQNETLRPFSRGRVPDVTSSNEWPSPRRDVRVPARRQATPEETAARAGSEPSLARQRTRDALRGEASILRDHQAESYRELRNRVIPQRGNAVDSRRITENIQRYRTDARAGVTRVPDMSAFRRRASPAAPHASGSSSAIRGHHSVPRMRPGVSPSFKMRSPSSVLRGRSIPSKAAGGRSGGASGRGRGGRR